MACYQSRHRFEISTLTTALRVQISSAIMTTSASLKSIVTPTTNVDFLCTNIDVGELKRLEERDNIGGHYS